jgi:flavin reductase (DIM6/NTAB) family NADH-FMN oxidoreductase RutF
MIDRDELRDVLAKFASGVTVVTSVDERGFHGVTVSAFCSLSLEPPLVLICVANDSQSRDLLAVAERFAVNILSRGQTFLAEQFSGQTPLADPTFSRVPHRLSPGGLPLINDTVAWLECRRWAEYEGGDHTIFIGAVEALGLGEQDDPLILFDRTFTELSWG